MSTSLWHIFAECFVLGVVAFTLPCIFPLAPLTISYFTQQVEADGGRAKSLRLAALYALSIIVIYVGLGLIMTMLFGAGSLNELASDGLFNLFVFAVLLFFGLSLLGFFELSLPSAWVNAISSRSGISGYAGIFFMAATLAIVSFSCTGPVIGSILVTVGVTAGYMAPMIGILGFSIALATIFFLLAVFPHWVNVLPKSGSWLNSVKVVLGFLEIALSMKFLSTADLAYHWQLLSRELFLGIWIALFVLLGLNLLGWIRLPHDSGVIRKSHARIFFSVISFAIATVLMTGLRGASLPLLSGLLPPPVGVASSVVSKQQSTTSAGPAQKKYADILHMPLQIDGFFDYEEALAYARRVHKPLLLDFTGHGCVNCRKMESEVWPHASILPLLKEKYIVVSLYTDDKTPLPDQEQFDSSVLRTRVNTVGKKFKHLQAQRYATLSQPYYVLVDLHEQPLVTPPIGVELDIAKYAAYLQEGLRVFQSRP